ncbi:MAG TPA: hypothetical protein VJB66_04255 [Candidatus Nanoarchaeia archaeon]|nr:hypothetical protein [Candidatus Nanoarchaeia archaeon]
MKKVMGIILLVFSVLLSLGVYAASAKQGTTAGVYIPTPFPVVNLLNQEPNPVQPGEIVTLRFQIQNNGTETKDSVVAELRAEFPFTPYGENNITIGKLRAGASGPEAVIVEFKLKVDESAAERDETVNLRLRYEGSQRTYTDFPVKIQTQDVELIVRDVVTDPKTVAPGDDFTLTLQLANNADSLLRNVKVKLNLSSSTPFVPTKTTAEASLYQINSNTQRSVSFDLTALPEATGGLYKIPIVVTYNDERGSAQQKQDFIGLKVSSFAELLVTIDQTTINSDNRHGEVTLKIVNRGLTDIKLMSAILEESDDYSVTTPEIYVGNIDSDDFETVDFTIGLKSYDSVVALPVVLEYRDITNKKFKETVIVSLVTGSSGLVLTIIFGLIRFVITIAVLAGIGYGGYWYYQRRKHKKAVAGK